MGESWERVKEEAMQIINSYSSLPRLVVFDLDYTLWPFYCECQSKREMPKLYPHAKGILLALKEKGIDVAVASRSPTADIANTFLDKLHIKSMFVVQEIYSSWTHKTEHFQRINRITGVPFNSMLFFDDEDRNIEAVSKMGVTSILVNDGVDLEAFRQGLAEFSRNSGIETDMMPPPARASSCLSEPSLPSSIQLATAAASIPASASIPSCPHVHSLPCLILGIVMPAQERNFIAEA